MATEQLPASQYVTGGQITLSGWQVISTTYGLEEDTETKQKGNGQFKCDITYMRRQTCQALIEAESGTTVSTYASGGTIASGTIPLADGSTASAWRIRNPQLIKTRGPVQVSLDLISLTDLLA